MPGTYRKEREQHRARRDATFRALEARMTEEMTAMIKRGMVELLRAEDAYDEGMERSQEALQDRLDRAP